MKVILSLIILTILCNQSHSQNIDPDFKLLVESFGAHVGPFGRDSVRIPVIYQSKDFSIRLATTSANFSTESIVLENPYSGKSYPLSYSIVYKEHIISLFEPGYFACYRLKDLSRNTDFEAELNLKKFKSHWLIDNELYAVSKGGGWHAYKEEGWKRTKKLPLPDNSRSNLYSDEEYLVYNNCNGEWGGTIFFYNRETQETFFTEATCANTIIDKESTYTVLASLGHGFGSADSKVIEDPSLLPSLKDFKPQRTVEAIGYKDTTRHAKEAFSYYGLQVFSMFQMGESLVYMLHWQGKTFLATLKNNEFFIIDPLFNSSLYTHEPITKRYSDGDVLINLDFWGRGREKEISMILIQGNHFRKIDWNRKN